MFLLAVLAGVMVFIVVFMILMVRYSRHLVNNALTRHFQAAEAVAAGKVPEPWVSAINRRLWQARLRPDVPRKRYGTHLALRRLDKLIRFFEKSAFLESEETRDMLLGQLRETRGRWETMTWDELSETQSDTTKRRKTLN